ncbi:MAG: hypothetical protein HYV26_09010 [Candidatus Hydrogenedentes bacterium]|nr:hypothetical protein [Candidatus Hydrogenedentota bacterium]
MANRLLVVRPISLSAFLIFLAVYSTALIMIALLWGCNVMLGVALLFLLYVLIARRWCSRFHQRGMKCLRKGDFTSAREEFEKSLAFFDRYPWADQYRSIVFFHLGKLAMREAALCNMVHCYVRLGDAKQVRHWLDVCLERYPDSQLAQNALRIFELGRSEVSGESSHNQ